MEKPKIQIVDENDKLIGHKKRDEVDYKNDIYRVTALWLTNSKGKILIAQRKFSKDKDPGKWGPAVSGTIDEGETYDENIVKETEEEIGLSGLDLKKGPYVRITEPRNYFVQWYLAIFDKPASEFSIQEEEVEQVAWISPGDLSEDVKQNSEKYISTMPGIIDLLA